ncbi:hypothetical protein NMY22_g1245 [Coprinellus aureogranulatus]|nr:hypothetical protein NMY22_g1245 [Coprinellus aureogranulatus]
MPELHAQVRGPSNTEALARTALRGEPPKKRKRDIASDESSEGSSSSPKLQRHATSSTLTLQSSPAAFLVQTATAYESAEGYALERIQSPFRGTAPDNYRATSSEIRESRQTVPDNAPSSHQPSGCLGGSPSALSTVPCYIGAPTDYYSNPFAGGANHLLHSGMGIRNHSGSIALLYAHRSSFVSDIAANAFYQASSSSVQPVAPSVYTESSPSAAYEGISEFPTWLLRRWRS